MNPLKTITTLAALTFIAGSANAASPTPRNDGARGPHRPRIVFEVIDANSDGFLTAEEFANHRALEFAKRDQNADGLLSPQEMKAASLREAARRIDMRIARVIKQRDANDDGSISLDELPGNARTKKMIERLDTDGDGAISKAEMDAAKKHFRAGAKRPANQ